MNFKALLLLMVTSFSLSTNAGILIEPYVGTGSYTTTFDAANFSSADDDASLTTMGSRLGYSFLLLSAGIDYQMDTLDELSRTNTSLFVGFDFPILLRAYGKYIVSSDMTSDESGAGDISFNSGYAVGLGFTGLPFVSLNVEIEASNYTSEISGFGESDFDFAATTFTISLPLDF